MSNIRKPSLPKELRDVPKLQKLLKTKPESYWQKRGEVMALRLFHDMAEHVPAYKDFLQQQNVDPQKIRTISDFKSVPTIDKDNYLRAYPLDALCWDGQLASQRWVISSTSGSTGEPFYFPRTDLQDEVYALTAELYLRENFQIHEKSTLYIDAFAMGPWIGGLFTYEAVHQVAQKGYAISLTTTGINKAEVINNVRRLGDQFDQVIIGCYPPMLRDIIDLGESEGLDWARYNLGIVFSAEGFSEAFRDYIAEHGKLSNILTSTLNHYGSVDIGTMSHETPLAIMARRQAIDDPKLFGQLFSEANKQPTFTQFLPELFYFEADEKRVICSSYAGLPLVRYDLKDNGGVLSLAEVKAAYHQTGKNLNHELETAGIAETVWNLPFVYLYERSDFSVVLVGGVIYPGQVHKALFSSPLPASLTGKFTLEVSYDNDLSSQLVVHIELKSRVEAKPKLAEQIQKAIVDTLLRENTEYASNYAQYGEKISPVIKLYPYGDAEHFSGQGKQKWVKKTDPKQQV